MELKTYADIGSVTTSTQGSTLIHFKKGKGSKLPKSMDEMIENRGFNGGHMEIGIWRFGLKLRMFFIWVVVYLLYIGS